MGPIGLYRKFVFEMMILRIRVLKMTLPLKKAIWRGVFCRFGVHKWVFVNRNRIGCCWGCDEFHYVNDKFEAVSRVTRLDRPTRRRMFKGVC